MNEVESLHIYFDEENTYDVIDKDIYMNMDSNDFIKLANKYELDFINDTRHTINRQQKGFINRLGIVVIFMIEADMEKINGIHYSPINISVS